MGKGIVFCGFSFPQHAHALAHQLPPWLLDPFTVISIKKGFTSRANGSFADQQATMFSYHSQDLSQHYGKNGTLRNIMVFITTPTPTSLADRNQQE